MAAPKYLTGEKAAIDEFIDKFDVSALSTILSKDETGILIGARRHFSSTAMVRRSQTDGAKVCCGFMR